MSPANLREHYQPRHTLSRIEKIYKLLIYKGLINDFGPYTLSYQGVNAEDKDRDILHDAKIRYYSKFLFIHSYF